MLTITRRGLSCFMILIALIASGCNPNIVNMNIGPTLIYKVTSVDSLTSSNASGSYSNGTSINITLKLDSINANVVGSPKILMNTNTYATYVSGSGSDTLIFSYLTKPTDNINKLDYKDQLAFRLSGATVLDDSGEKIDMTLPVVGAKSISSLKSIHIDTQAPNLSAVIIDSGAIATISTSVSVTISASDNSGTILKIKLASDLALTNGSWVDFDGTLDYQIPSIASGVQTVYAQIMDAAGNTSVIKSNSISMAYGDPPTIEILSPKGGVKYETLGESIDVQFKVVSIASLKASNPIQLFYTLDNGLTTNDLNLSVYNTANNGCTITGVATGCVRFLLPAPILHPQDFKLQMGVSNIYGSSSIALGSTLNREGLRVIVGRDSSTPGGNATQSMLGYHPSETIFMASDGTLYISKYSPPSIYKINKDNGNYEIFLGGGTNNDGVVAGKDIKLNSAWTRMAESNANEFHYSDGYQIRKVNKTTKIVETIFGQGALGFTEGMQANDLKIISLYDFKFMSTDEIIILCRTLGDLGRALLKIKTDGTVTKLAGDFSTTALNGLAYPLPAQTSGINDMAYIAINAEDENMIFLVHLLQGVFKLDISANQLTKHAVIYMSNQRNVVWDKAGKRLIVGYHGGIVAFDPNTQNSFVSLGNYLEGYERSIAADKFGGLYFTSINGDYIGYLSPDNSYGVYAGIETLTDNIHPLQAELRNPGQVRKDKYGNIWFYDAKNAYIRKVNTEGTLLTNNRFIPGNLSGAIHLLLDDDEFAIYAGAHWSPKKLTAAATGACIYACSTNGAHPYIQDSAANGVSMTGNLRTSNNDIYAMAYDHLTGDAYFMARDLDADGGGNLGTYIFKMDTAKDLSFIAGQGQVPGVTTLGNPSVTNPLDDNRSIFSYNIEVNSPGKKFDAYNSVVYRCSANRKIILAITDGGNISKEVDVGVSTGIYSFHVDGTNNILYYMQGNLLYKQTLGNSASAVMIKDFGEKFYLQDQGVSANSLLMVKGNQIFEYTDAVNIP